MDQRQQKLREAFRLCNEIRESCQDRVYVDSNISFFPSREKYFSSGKSDPRDLFVSLNEIICNHLGPQNDSSPNHTAANIAPAGSTEENAPFSASLSTITIQTLHFNGAPSDEHDSDEHNMIQEGRNNATEDATNLVDNMFLTSAQGGEVTSEFDEIFSIINHDSKQWMADSYFTLGESINPGMDAFQDMKFSLPDPAESSPSGRVSYPFVIINCNAAQEDSSRIKQENFKPELQPLSTGSKDKSMGSKGLGRRRLPKLHPKLPAQQKMNKRPFPEAEGEEVSRPKSRRRLEV